MVTETEAPASATDRLERKARAINRLKRIEGQVRGLQKMIEQDRDCLEILSLLAGIKSALEATGDVVLEAYFEECSRELASGEKGAAQLLAALKMARR